MLTHLLLYFLGFVLVWIGSGWAIKDITSLSRRLHFSSFAISFLFLGFFTSISEASVGLNAVAQGNPEIFVGNLIGASIVIFLLIIPLMAVWGNGLRMVHSLSRQNLILALITVAVPVFLIFDHVVSLPDAIIFIVFYGYLFMALHEERGIRAFLESLLAFREVTMLRLLGKVVLAVAMILIASRLIVDQTVYFAELLDISPFIISLLVISIGTNIPELSIAARSLWVGRRDVALGNYLGSAAFNTLLMGFLTLVNGSRVTMTTSFTLPLVFLVVGLYLFYRFGRSQNTLSRKEGWLLLALYGLFVVLGIMTVPELT